MSMRTGMLWLCGVVLVALMMCGQEVRGDTCTYFDSHMGATFDISELQRIGEQPPYVVEDGDNPCTKKVEGNYTYVFNVCGTVTGSYPPQCSDKKGSSPSALQINFNDKNKNDDDWCYLAGVYTSSVKPSLLHADDPTKGLMLSYYGDICGSTKKPRQVNIEIQCADRLSAVPTHAIEYETCVYTITMPTVYGCPLECPVANRHLCGGNGHCAYDTDKGGARCFCNKGFGGTDCTQTSSTSTSNYSPALLGLIITLFIIVVLLAGSIVYMVRQMDAYKEDLAHYQSLKGGEDDSAVV